MSLGFLLLGDLIREVVICAKYFIFSFRTVICIAAGGIYAQSFPLHLDQYAVSK
jgi:hypothetical protein